MRKLLILGAMLGLVGLMPAVARADFVVQVAADGGAWTTVASSSPGSGGTLSFATTIGDFTIGGGMSSSSSPSALTEVGTFSITNNASGTGSHTLNIRVSAQDFSIPSGSGAGLVLAGTVSGSVAKGTLSSGDFTASIDTSNALFGTATSAPTITFGPTGAINSFSGSSSTGVDVATTPYSMTIVGDWTLSNGGKLTLTGGNGAVTVPEPASMGMFVLGAGVLGIFSLRQRRRPA